MPQCTAAHRCTHPQPKHLAMCMLIVKNHTRATARTSCAHALPCPQTPQSFRHPPLTQCSASLPHQKFPLQHCSLQWKPPNIGPQRPPRSARGALTVRLQILGCCNLRPGAPKRPPARLQQSNAMDAGLRSRIINTSNALPFFFWVICLHVWQGLITTVHVLLLPARGCSPCWLQRST